MCHVSVLGPACVFALLAAGCAGRTVPRLSPTADLTFLTRDGCVATATMRGNLDAALTAMGLPTDYRVVDVDTLPETDARGGYGTPTILVKGVDLFDMPTPPAPHPPPT
jgi:hypothetical protein